MRLDYLFFSLIALLASANSTQVNLTHILSEIPSCALGCITKQLSSTCNLSNPTCICANQTIQSELSICVQGTCTAAELTELAVANNELCVGFPIETRGSEVVTIGVVLISITIPIILLRCWSRYSIAKSLWWDDWSILVAAGTLVGIIVTDVIDSNLGFGRHLWDVQASNTVQLLKIFFFSEILYILALVSTKASILLFYLRIFRRPMFRTVVMINIGFVIASGIAFIFAIIFQCNPVSGVWDKTLSARCIDVTALAYANAGVGIAQDVIILFLPVSELADLQMSLKKKLNVMAMFGIGGFACITSIIRLRFIVSFNNSKDPTWDNVVPSIWSLIEVCVAMICACLPAIRALLSYWFPVLFGLTTRASKNQLSNSGQLESHISRTGGRKVPEAANDDDEEMIIQGPNSRGQDVKIIRIKEFEEIPPPMPPKTPRNISGYSESRFPNWGESDEAEFLEVGTAIPLRNVREQHNPRVAAQIAVGRLRSAR